MLKRFTVLLLCLTMIASSVGCGTAQNVTDTQPAMTTPYSEIATDDEDMPQLSDSEEFIMNYREYGVALADYPELKAIEGTNVLIDLATYNPIDKGVLVYAYLYDTTVPLNEATGLAYAFAVVGMDGNIDEEAAKTIAESAGLDFSSFEEITKDDGYNAFASVSVEPIKNGDVSEKLMSDAESLKPDTIKVFKRLVYVERPETDKFVFDGILLDGGSISSEELFGRADYTLINFWATWCISCINELEELQALNDLLAERNAQVVLVCSDVFRNTDETAMAAQNILDSHSVTLTCLRMTTDLEDQAMLYNYPTSYIVDKSGKIQADELVGVGSADDYLEYINTVIG